jgi:hypothetical protein
MEEMCQGLRSLPHLGDQTMSSHQDVQLSVAALCVAGAYTETLRTGGFVRTADGFVGRVKMYVNSQFSKVCYIP